ncbi:MAG: hypothetical protein J7M14_02185 [Planctomycetes bacterium]|nr:hypothetical protein [Planctomycetota bacterium]
MVLTGFRWSCDADCRRPLVGIRRLGRVVCLCLVAALSGCATDTGTFETARGHDTVASYQAYLKNFGQGKHREEASGRIDELDFAKARKTNSVSAYSTYLKKHPSGRFASKARQLASKARHRAHLLKGRLMLERAISAGRYSLLPVARDYADKHGLRVG